MILENNKELRCKQIPTRFTWEGLGDLEEGRALLGDSMPVIVYRLLQYTLKDVLTRELDHAYACALFRESGHLAGLEFAKHCLDLSGEFDFFITNLQRTLKELKIGILRIEQADLETFHFTLTVSEDLDCSGLPVTDETVCDYDEGFIAGILEAYTGTVFDVREVDCWANGDRTCRFQVKPEAN